MQRLRISLSILGVFILSVSLMAQVPRVINYQGMLLGADEKPVAEGDYQITFNLYDDANTLIWSEIHGKVLIAGGIFHVLLGTVNPLDIPFEKPYFLGIKVGNDPELQPRMMLTAAAYSMNSARVNGFTVSATPEPNTLCPLGSDGKFPASVVSAGSASGDFLRKNAPDTTRGTSTSPLLIVNNLGNGDGMRILSASGRAVEGKSDKLDGVVGWTAGSDVSGVFGHSTDGIGVTGRSTNHFGVLGATNSLLSDHAGIEGRNNGAGPGVRGSGSNYGVFGEAVSGAGYGVAGKATGIGSGGYFWSLGVNGNGVSAYATNTGGVGIYAEGGSGGLAALFKGNVVLLSKSSSDTLIELGGGLDYAEGFHVSNKEDVVPGTVLVINPESPGKLMQSCQAYDQKVAGIVAGAKGLGSGVRLGAGGFDFDVALAGRVYCNVDATFGAVEPGDLLTTAPTPGYAMVVKVYEKAQGAILGKAMEKLAQGQKGQILVLVTLQ